MLLALAIAASSLVPSVAAPVPTTQTATDVPHVGSDVHSWPGMWTRITKELALPPVQLLTEGAIRTIWLDGRANRGQVYELAVLPDGVRVRVLRIDFTQHIVTHEDGRISSHLRTARRQEAIADLTLFEMTRRSTITELLPAGELAPPLPRRPGSERGCIDGILSVTEISLHYPTPLYLIRHSPCGERDPVFRARVMIEHWSKLR
jgi:hypothetical protein